MTSAALLQLGNFLGEAPRLLWHRVFSAGLSLVYYWLMGTTFFSKIRKSASSSDLTRGPPDMAEPQPSTSFKKDN